jgi:hypothetical protein
MVFALKTVMFTPKTVVFVLKTMVLTALISRKIIRVRPGGLVFIKL